MGKKSGPSAPAPPDPKVTAAAQAAANKETAIAQAGLNAINQYDPSGSITYQQVGTWPDGTPRFEQRTTLSPEQQALYDTETRLSGNLGNLAEEQLGRLSGTLNSPLDLTGLGAAPGVNDFGAQRDAVTEALFSRLNPQLDRERASLETRLANQGITRGSEAWNQGLDEFNRTSTDARMQALLAGGQEQSRLYGISSDARQQALTELLTQRNQPLNEISALMSGTQVSMPQQRPTPATAIAPTDVIGPTNAAYQGQLAAWQQGQQNRGGLLGGLAGLGGSILGGWARTGFTLPSDRRLKQDIRRVGKLDNGLPVYAYRYLGSPFTMLGVMADEVAEVKPAAVYTAPSGYQLVDYAEAVR